MDTFQTTPHVDYYRLYNSLSRGNGAYFGFFGPEEYSHMVELCEGRTDLMPITPFRIFHHGGRFNPQNPTQISNIHGIFLHDDFYEFLRSLGLGDTWKTYPIVMYDKKKKVIVPQYSRGLIINQSAKSLVPSWAKLTANSYGKKCYRGAWFDTSSITDDRFFRTGLSLCPILRDDIKEKIEKKYGKWFTFENIRESVYETGIIGNIPKENPIFQKTICRISDTKNCTQVGPNIDYYELDNPFFSGHIGFFKTFSSQEYFQIMGLYGPEQRAIPAKPIRVFKDVGRCNLDDPIQIVFPNGIMLHDNFYEFLLSLNLADTWTTFPIEAYDHTKKQKIPQYSRGLIIKQFASGVVPVWAKNIADKDGTKCYKGVWFDNEMISDDRFFRAGFRLPIIIRSDIKKVIEEKYKNWFTFTHLRDVLVPCIIADEWSKDLENNQKSKLSLFNRIRSLKK